MTILDYIKPIENITEIQKSELEIQFKIKTLEIDKKIIDVQEKKNMLLDELKLACDGINHHISSDLKNIKLDSIINENNKHWNNDLNNINEEISKLENDKKFLNDLFNILVGNTVKESYPSFKFLPDKTPEILKSFGVYISPEKCGPWNQPKSFVGYLNIPSGYYGYLNIPKEIMLKCSDITPFYDELLNIINPEKNKKLTYYFEKNFFVSTLKRGNIHIFYNPEDQCSPYFFHIESQISVNRFGESLMP